MDEVEVKRLRWRCRRGVRELDILLTCFLDERYPLIDDDERASFAALVECQDPDVMDWLTERRADYPRDCAAAVRLLLER